MMRIKSKKERKLLQDIETYEIHANREIQNNKVCRADKVRDNSQRYLKKLIEEWEAYTGKQYSH